MRLAAADARERVSQGNYHPRWRGWIELLIEPEVA
jgi:hypothetical protein